MKFGAADAYYSSAHMVMGYFHYLVMAFATPSAFAVELAVALLHC